MGSKPTNQSPLTKAVKTVTGYPQFGLIVGLIALLIVMAFITPSFFSFDTIVSQLQNNSIYAILAVGVMMVILTGGITTHLFAGFGGGRKSVIYRCYTSIIRNDRFGIDEFFYRTSCNFMDPGVYSHWCRMRSH